MTGDVFKGPLDVLMLGELSCESARLLATHPQQSVVRWQHYAIKHHHILVIMVSSGFGKDFCYKGKRVVGVEWRIHCIKIKSYLTQKFRKYQFLITCTWCSLHYMCVKNWNYMYRYMRQRSEKLELTEYNCRQFVCTHLSC